VDIFLFLAVNSMRRKNEWKSTEDLHLYERAHILIVPTVHMQLRLELIELWIKLHLNPPRPLRPL